MFDEDDRTKSMRARCSGCKYQHIVYANGGFNFYGCYCRPYTGKRVSEIKDCPKGSGENEVN